MSSRPSFSLRRALPAAFAFLPSAWGGAWAILTVLWAASTFGHLLGGPGTDIHHIIRIETFYDVKMAGLAVALAVLQLVARGALYRIGLFGKTARKEGLGIGGLQFGAPELRLLAAELIVGLFIAMIILAIIIVFAIAFDTAGLSADHPDTLTALAAMLNRHEGSDWVFIAYLVAAWMFLIFLGLKFSLMRAATIAERRIVTLNALGLSSGNVGKLFAGFVIFLLPFLALIVVVVHHLMPFMADHVPVKEGLFTPAMILHMVLQALGVFLLLPLLTGFLASAYRQIIELRAK